MGKSCSNPHCKQRRTSKLPSIPKRVSNSPVTEIFVGPAHTMQPEGLKIASPVALVETSAAARHCAAAAGTWPTAIPVSSPSKHHFRSNCLPITSTLNGLYVLRRLRGRGANPCLISESHDSLIFFPSPAPDPKKNLGYSAQVNGPCSKRFGVRHQWDRPGARTDKSRVKGGRFHLPAHGIERSKPIGILRLGQIRAEWNLHRSEFELGKHFRLRPPDLLAAPVLRFDGGCERTHDQDAFSGQLLAPRPFVVIRFERVQFRQSRRRRKPPARRMFSEIEPHCQYIEAWERPHVSLAKAGEDLGLRRIHPCDAVQVAGDVSPPDSAIAAPVGSPQIVPQGSHLPGTDLAGGSRLAQRASQLVIALLGGQNARTEILRAFHQPAVPGQGTRQHFQPVVNLVKQALLSTKPRARPEMEAKIAGPPSRPRWTWTALASAEISLRKTFWRNMPIRWRCQLRTQTAV